MEIFDLAEPFVIIVSKEEILNGETSEIINIFESMLSSKDNVRKLKENVDIAFSGYDEDTRELFEIDQVRDFVFKLDEKFPYWLYFLSKRHLGLQCILFCMLPPYLTEEGKAKIFPQKIEALLINRWFPAMNHICENVGMGEDDIEELTKSSLDYITNGRQKK